MIDNHKLIEGKTKIDTQKEKYRNGKTNIDTQTEKYDQGRLIQTD